MKTPNIVIILAVAMSVLLVAPWTYGADKWGSLKGTFKYDGDPPKPVLITVDKDPEFCGKHNLVEESLIVDSKTKGIQNVVVYLYQEPTDSKALRIHPDLLAAAKRKVRWNIANCRFDPHIIAVMIDQVVNLRNADPIGHAMMVSTLPPVAPIIPVPAKGEIEHRFKDRESLPTRVNCPVHAWMSAFIVVKDHPYVAVTGVDGAFEIKNLPAGKWTFQVWHEKAGYVVKVAIGGKDKKWEKGRVDVTIEPNKLVDLGEVLVAPSNFRK